VTRARAAALPILGLRVAYGAGLIAAPERLARRWLGPASASGPTQVALRGIGGREVAVHATAIGAALWGAPVRPWLAASITGDLADIAATTIARHELPDRSAVAALVVAGASALVTAALAVAIEE
jgi:hypothetical protein